MAENNTEIFLSAKWCNLLHISYFVDKELLAEIKPPNIELDICDGKAAISLVAFEIIDPAVKNINQPFYKSFSEVNLRFYVTDKNGNNPGVVFIKELVPKELIAAAANAVYNEKYSVADIKCDKVEGFESVKYDYTINNKYTLSAITETRSKPLPENTIQHKLKQRNYGYGISNYRTIRYKVEHALWEVFPLNSYLCNIDFGELFGEKWKFLNYEKPFDVMMAAGSDVKVYDWEYLEV